ncbi:uncharacterized protein [Atheta coriaria]|uniref:uncharacterized protein isoform X2 n=1 Tax=Dalotia coriaria TaxID=877792 RepID=UPI0031F3CB5C
MSVRILLIIMLLYSSDVSWARKDNLKHVFLKDTPQKQELVDKFLDLIEASWDYIMQILYYKANLLGLDKEREGSDHIIMESPIKLFHSFPGWWMMRDFYMGFMDVIFEDVEEEVRPHHNQHQNHQQHGGHHQHQHQQQQHGHGHHQRPRPHAHRPHRPQQSNENNHIGSHLSTIGSLLHHGRSFEEMKDSGLHKLLVRWKLCDQ